VIFDLDDRAHEAVPTVPVDTRQARCAKARQDRKRSWSRSDNGVMSTDPPTPMDKGPPARPFDQTFAAGPGTGTGAAQERVLLVDDDDLIRTVGARHLARAGFDVTVADTVASAATCCGPTGFDVAVLDYFLEAGRSGCELIPVLRAANPATRIAVLSGLAVLPEIALRAYLAGAHVVAPKAKIEWQALVRCAVGNSTGITTNLAAFRRAFVHGTYWVHQRNVSRTARALGIRRTSLQRLLREAPPPAIQKDAQESED
jgi:ActR/RegA family two-component response regulator